MHLSKFQLQKVQSPLDKLSFKNIKTDRLILSGLRPKLLLSI